MKKKSDSFLTVFLLACVATSCQKNLELNTVNSSSLLKRSIGFKLEAFNKSFPVGTVIDNSVQTSISYSMMNEGENRPALSWDSAYMNISAIKFNAERHKMDIYSDSAAFSQEWSGTRKIDLFNTNDMIGSIPIQPADYSAISIAVNSDRKDFGKAPVFYLSGNYTNAAGIKIPVKVKMNENLTIYSDQADFEVDSLHNFIHIIHLNLSSMMSRLKQSDLDDAALSNGEMLINMNSNPGLYWYMRVDFDRSMYSELLPCH